MACARLCRLETNLRGPILRHVLDVVGEADFQLPVPEEPQLAQGRFALRVNALSLLQDFTFDRTVKGHTLATGHVNSDRGGNFELVFYLKLKFKYITLLCLRIL